MTEDFPKAKFHFTKCGSTVTVTEVNSEKSMDFFNQSDGEIDTEFLLLGFVTTYPDIEIY
jgi:hypothetical protein